jgi:hypothetical protein
MAEPSAPTWTGQREHAASIEPLDTNQRTHAIKLSRHGEHRGRALDRTGIADNLPEQIGNHAQPRRAVDRVTVETVDHELVVDDANRLEGVRMLGRRCTIESVDPPHRGRSLLDRLGRTRLRFRFGSVRGSPRPSPLRGGFSTGLGRGPGHVKDAGDRVAWYVDRVAI